MYIQFCYYTIIKGHSKKVHGVCYSFRERRINHHLKGADILCRPHYTPHSLLELVA